MFLRNPHPNINVSRNCWFGHDAKKIFAGWPGKRQKIAVFSLQLHGYCKKSAHTKNPLFSAPQKATFGFFTFSIYAPVCRFFVILSHFWGSQKWPFWPLFATVCFHSQGPRIATRGSPEDPDTVLESRNVALSVGKIVWTHTPRGLRAIRRFVK